MHLLNKGRQTVIISRVLREGNKNGTLPRKVLMVTIRMVTGNLVCTPKALPRRRKQFTVRGWRACAKKTKILCGAENFRDAACRPPIVSWRAVTPSYRRADTRTPAATAHAAGFVESSPNPGKHGEIEA